MAAGNGNSRKCMTPKRWSVLLAVLGVGCIGLGVSVYFMVNGQVHSTINQLAVLTDPSSEMFQQWQKPKIAIYESYYVYNVTNPDAVLQGADAEITECGPYRYREERSRVNITWNEDQTIVHYTDVKILVFDPLPGSGWTNDNDKIVNVNLGIQGVIAQLEKTFHGTLLSSLGEILAKDFIEVVSNEPFFRTYTVRSFLFSFTEDFLNRVNTFLEKYVGWLIKKRPIIDPMVSMQLLEEYVPNTSVYTGKDDLKKLGRYITYGGQKALNFWNGPECNAINGTDGTYFSPWLEKGKDVAVFVDDIWRSAFLKYGGEVEFRGIKLYRYLIGPMTLANSTMNPLNAGFYDNGPDGVLNMTSVTEFKGVPVFASKPHFLDASPQYLRNLAITSVSDPNQHDTYLDVEPMTGVVMRAEKRLQVNVAIKAIPKYHAGTANLQNIMMPLFWAGESGLLDEDDAEQFKNSLYLPLNGSLGGMIAGCVVGVLLLTISLVVIYRSRKSGGSDFERRPLLEDPCAHGDATDGPYAD